MKNSFYIDTLSSSFLVLSKNQDVSREVRREYIEKQNIKLYKKDYLGPLCYVFEEAIYIKVCIEGNLKDSYKKFINLIEKAFEKFNLKLQIRGLNAYINDKKILTVGVSKKENCYIFESFINKNFNIEKYLKAVHIPVEKLSSQGIKLAEDRFTYLSKESIEKDDLIEELIKHLKMADFTKKIEGLNLKPIKDIETKNQNYIQGLYRCAGGTFRIDIKEENNIVKDIAVSGDFVIFPESFIEKLISTLKDKTVDNYKSLLEDFTEKENFDSIEITKKDIKEAFLFPIRKLEAKEFGIETNLVIASLGASLKENLSKAKVMLLPYCAKPTWCDYRHLDDCGECGGCTVGDLYRLSYEKGMIPLTITSFELLRDTLLWCAENNYSYIGHCCTEFFEKRYEIFKKASQEGSNGVLIDIKGTTCYSLGVEEEEKAYHGEFRAELDLFVKESEILLNTVKTSQDHNINKNFETFEQNNKNIEFSKYFKEFIPPYYKKPKAIPSLKENLTRSYIQKELNGKDYSINGEFVSFEELKKEIADSVRLSKKIAFIIGPLLIWDFKDKALEEESYEIKKLIEKVNPSDIKVLPDYNPRLKKYDPKYQIDPPNPHEAINYTENDLTFVTGVHCYRTDFIIRLLKKYTNTKIISICNLYGHPEADLSLGFANSEKINSLIKVI